MEYLVKKLLKITVIDKSSKLKILLSVLLESSDCIVHESGCLNSSKDEIIQSPPQLVFLSDQFSLKEISDFLTTLSQNYIFQHTSFYLIISNEVDEIEKIKLMTLGISGIAHVSNIESMFKNAVRGVEGTSKNTAA